MSKHAVVHIELSAKDPKAAGKFYSDLFGWKIEHDEKMDYTMFQPEEGPGGGFSPVGEQTNPGDVLLYVQCDDIDGTLAKAESLGGTTAMPKTEIPAIGWFGIFVDPTGNRVGVYTGMGADEG